MTDKNATGCVPEGACEAEAPPSIAPPDTESIDGKRTRSITTTVRGTKYSEPIILRFPDEEEESDPIKRRRYHKRCAHNVMRCLHHIGPRGQAILGQDELQFRGKLKPIRKDGQPLSDDPAFWHAKVEFLYRKYEEIERELKPWRAMNVLELCDKPLKARVMSWMQPADVANWNEPEETVQDFVDERGTPPIELVHQLWDHHMRPGNPDLRTVHDPDGLLDRIYKKQDAATNQEAGQSTERLPAQGSQDPPVTPQPHPTLGLGQVSSVGQQGSNGPRAWSVQPTAATQGIAGGPVTTVATPVGQTSAQSRGQHFKRPMVPVNERIATSPIFVRNRRRLKPKSTEPPRLAPSSSLSLPPGSSLIPAPSSSPSPAPNSSPSPLPGLMAALRRGQRRPPTRRQVQASKPKAKPKAKRKTTQVVQPPEPVRPEIRTRSGRISRPPVRLQPY